MSDLRDLYQEIILDHNRRPRNYRCPADANREAHGDNPLCGDRVTVYLTLKDGVVRDVGFQGRGCAISMASASLLTELLKGRTEAEARALFRRFHETMTGEGLPEDPSPLLAGLHQDYDLAVRLSVQNIPQNLRDQAIDQIRNVARLATVRQSGQAEEEFRQQQQNVEMQLAALSLVLEQVDHVTLGLLVDGKARKLAIDVGLEFTEAAVQQAGGAPLATAPASLVAGAMLPGALGALHFNVAGPAEQAAGLAAPIQTLRTEWLENIEQDTKIHDPRLKALLKQLEPKLMLAFAGEPVEFTDQEARQLEQVAALFPAGNDMVRLAARDL
mgnify:CR=1 FL=1